MLVKVLAKQLRSQTNKIAQPLTQKTTLKWVIHASKLFLPVSLINFLHYFEQCSDVDPEPIPVQVDDNVHRNNSRSNDDTDQIKVTTLDTNAEVRDII